MFKFGGISSDVLSNELNRLESGIELLREYSRLSFKARNLPDNSTLNQAFMDLNLDDVLNELKNQVHDSTTMESFVLLSIRFSNLYSLAQMISGEDITVDDLRTFKKYVRLSTFFGPKSRL
jgi:hypothetical protein